MDLMNLEYIIRMGGVHSLINIYFCTRQYGKQLYINFQDAMRKSEAAYDWSSLSSSSIKSGSSSSSLPGGCGIQTTDAFGKSLIA